MVARIEYDVVDVRLEGLERKRCVACSNFFWTVSTFVERLVGYGGSQSGGTLASLRRDGEACTSE